MLAISGSCSMSVYDACYIRVAVLCQDVMLVISCSCSMSGCDAYYI